MTRMSLGLASLALGLGLLGAAQAREPDSFQMAQVMTTPPGCFWLDAGGGDQDLWCRDEDGRARRTATRRHDDGGVAAWGGCGPGRLDNGVRCVSEGSAIRSAQTGERYDPTVNAPPPFDWRANKTSDGRWRDPNRPDVVIVGDGYRWRRNYVIHDAYD